MLSTCVVISRLMSCWLKSPAVHERREQGRTTADHMAVPGLPLMDEFGILAGGDGEFRADQADAGELRADDVLGGLLHDADDAEVEAGTKTLRHRGDGVHATAVHFTPLEPRNWSIWQLSSKI